MKNTDTYYPTTKGHHDVERSRTSLYQTLFLKKTPNCPIFITKRPSSDLAEHVKILFQTWSLFEKGKEFLRIIETHIPRYAL